VPLRDIFSAAFAQFFTLRAGSQTLPVQKECNEQVAQKGPGARRASPAGKTCEQYAAMMKGEA
jgi:hypothetical protein